jgi:hypothetical protein
MRRFFVSLFIVSLLAVGGTYYWRTYYPEALSAAPVSGQLRSLAPGEKAHRTVAERAPSDRQDLAMMVSVVSSLVSAAAAVAQAWYARRAMKA